MNAVTRPQRAKYLDRLHNLTIRISGEQKNRILDHAESKGISVSQLVEFAVWEFIRLDKGIPNPGPSQFKKPTAEDVLRGYLSGESVLQPCGKVACDQKIVKFQGLEFCETCNVRVG